MTAFLKTIQPHILSDDPTIQHFALSTIRNARLGNDETFHLALDANDKNRPVKQTNTILPYTYTYQIGQAGVQRLVDLIKKKDNNLTWYRTIFSHLDSELMEEYFKEVRPVFEEEHLNQLENVIKLNHLSVGELQDEHLRVINEMEAQGFYNSTLYRYSKRITDRLIKMNALTTEEIGKIIKEEMNQNHFSYKGFMAIYAAGELKIHSLVEDLTKLTLRGSEEILIEEVEAALIKIGTDEVITLVASYALDPDEFYSPIAVLKNSKSDLAVENLLSLFDQATDLTAKTLMAEALCSQLSTEAIPKLEDFMEQGYDNGYLEMEKDLYATCMISGVDHPKLNSWKSIIEKREAKRSTRGKIAFTPPPPSPPASTISRNAPCPCGSGKKYKKCCGK